MAVTPCSLVDTWRGGCVCTVTRQAASIKTDLRNAGLTAKFGRTAALARRKEFEFGPKIAAK
jgi:hypothetical protein